MTAPTCRLCGSEGMHSFLDLGAMPLANCYVTPEQAQSGLDHAYDLHARLCPRCLLVQVNSVVPPAAIFSDYAYFSSVSSSWVAHARRYAAAMIERFGLGPQSLVMEVASNDGYLLQHFRAAGVPVLGIEPAANIAEAARDIGVPTETLFFDATTAIGLVRRYGRADLAVANNVLAHVPDIAGFAAGFAVVLQPDGVATFEFPHVLELIEHVQFDTIYHEHFSYLSLLVVERILKLCGLRVFDVEQLPTHGGSLRVFVCHAHASHVMRSSVPRIRRAEAEYGLHQPEGYARFAPKAAETIRSLQAFVAERRLAGRRVAAYGAAAKGNTLLNAGRIGADDIICVADRSPAKQGRLLPGSHIPVVTPEALAAARPDDVVILPWNIADEIAAELAPLRDAGTRLWVAIPQMRAI